MARVAGVTSASRWRMLAWARRGEEGRPRECAWGGRARAAARCVRALRGVRPRALRAPPSRARAAGRSTGRPSPAPRRGP
eukprot:6352059-Prymnesium_polylepis.1